MTNWTTKIEKKREEETQKALDENRQKEARKKAGQEAEQQREKLKWKNKQARNLSWHQLRFKCHICRKPSSGPGTSEQGTGRYSSTGDIGSVSWEITNTVTDWNKPVDLVRCEKCKKWTCTAHIYLDICQMCGERL